MLYNQHSGSEVHHNGNIFKDIKPEIWSLGKSCRVLLNEPSNRLKSIKTGRPRAPWSSKRLPRRGSLKILVFRWWMWSSTKSPKRSWSSTSAV